MAQNQTTFSDRVGRIGNARAASRSGRGNRGADHGVVVHPDGFTQTITPRPKRLRFGFPLKGVIFASVVAVLVKGYLIWTLGDDVYGAAVAQLLNGNGLERAAGLVLAPDAVSLFVVDAFQQIHRFVVSVATALETGAFPGVA